MPDHAAQRLPARPRSEDRQIPGAFQLLVAVYVVMTGDLPTAMQGALFGLEAGAEREFFLAMASSLASDLLLLAPLLVLVRHRLGIFHPLLLAVVIWPLLVRAPSVVQEFAVWSGLALGQRVDTPYYHGLGWRPSPEVWLAVAKFNLMEIVGLASTYLGFGLWHGRSSKQRRLFEVDPAAIRKVLLLLIAISTFGLLALMAIRGGLSEHIADLARGRFRSLAGLGPFVVLGDLGTISIILWMAIRPHDAKSPLFLSSLFFVAAVQFGTNGSRTAAVTVFMLAGVMWSLRTRRVPWRIALIVGPLAFFSLGVLGIVRASGLTNLSATEAVVSTSSSDILSGIQAELRARRALSAHIPVVADGFEVTDGPLWGRSYLAAVLGFIPRSVWEEKPRGPGSIYAQTFLGQIREGTAIPIGPTAEAYWNFGVPGVMILFFLYGVLIKQVYVFYEPRSGNPFVACFYVLFLTLFRLHTDNMVLFMFQMLMLLVAYFVIRGFAGANPRRIGPSPSAYVPALKA